ncbi:NADPH-hemoprotein reductase [Aureococcus anophagefferens]|nr:NADPH-hemoprotein reductase [Aureococcus anophagefferens]
MAPMKLLAVLACVNGLRPPANTPLARDTRAEYSKESAGPQIDLLAKQHRMTVMSVERAKLEVFAAYAPRIAELEAQLKIKELEAQIAANGAAPANGAAAIPIAPSAPVALPDAPAAPTLDFLEYAEIPQDGVQAHGALQVGDPEREARDRARRARGDLPRRHDDGGQAALRRGPVRRRRAAGEQGRQAPPAAALLHRVDALHGDDGAGDSVSLCVRRAVYVDPETGKEDPAKKGICSNFLCDGSPGDVVALTGPVGKGLLLPESPDADVIMVATGTGVAPYRGFVKRLFDEQTPANDAFTGRAWLFFGGPTSDSILYPELWDAAKASKPDQFDLTLAISREQTNKDGGRMYVQHRIVEHADEIFDRLDNGAHFYLCGLKGMQPGIEAALEEVCDKKGLVFKDWVKALKKDKRYHVEVY